MNLAMPKQENDDFSGKLRRLIETIDIANMLTSPIIGSIRNLLEVSASAVGWGEASVLIRDGSDGDLRFLIAIGEVAEQLSQVRIPGRERNSRLCSFVGATDGRGRRRR